jgi:tRNA (cytidine/uridine-2'-O-)-methyltransferase
MARSSLRLRQIGHPNPRNLLLFRAGPAAAASYTVKEAELCDRLPHKTAAARETRGVLYSAVGHRATGPGTSDLRLALFQPDIPQNTGALLRLAACFGIAVDLIEPFGFVLDDRRLRRAVLDYAARVAIERHASWGAFLAARDPTCRLILLTTLGTAPLHRFAFLASDTLLLGRESAGVPDFVHTAASARVVIPLQPGNRSLNVAMAGAIALHEALRQTGQLPEP